MRRETAASFSPEIGNGTTRPWLGGISTTVSARQTGSESETLEDYAHRLMASSDTRRLKEQVPYYLDQAASILGAGCSALESTFASDEAVLAETAGSK